jgi:hypothetical protein
MLPDGKEWIWLLIGLALGWFVVPMLMARKANVSSATPAGY